MHSFIKKGYQLRVDRKIGRIKISQPRFNPSSVFTKYLTEGNTLLHLKQSGDFFFFKASSSDTFEGELHNTQKH